MPPFGVAFGVGEGDDFSGGTCAEVGGVVDGLGLAGGVDSSAGGVLSAGVDGVAGGAEAGCVGVGVGDSGVPVVHSLSPPFQAAIRWYGVMMLSGSYGSGPWPSPVPPSYVTSSPYRSIWP